MTTTRLVDATGGKVDLAETDMRVTFSAPVRNVRLTRTLFGGLEVRFVPLAVGAVFIDIAASDTSLLAEPARVRVSAADEGAEANADDGVCVHEQRGVASPRAQ